MTGSGRRYQVLCAVGRGAYGTVYRAELLGEGDFRKEVAIKLMNPEVADVEDMARRQRDEARILGLVRHRAILQVDGLHRLNGQWAVVMEYVDGATLAEVLREGPLPPSCALAVVGEVAGALRVAHGAVGPDGAPLQVVHRDIKPGNLQLTAAGEVKVLDFGVAHADFRAREAQTQGVLLGTLRYMAPERLDGVDSPAGDLYALGVVLAEMLSRRPFTKTSAHPDRHQATIAQALADVGRVLGPDHDDLADLVASCLAYDPERRPTAEELVRHVEELGRRYRQPRLQDWAAAVVPRAQAARRKDLGEDGLAGTILQETSSAPSPAAARPAGRPPTAGLVAAVALGGGLLGLTALLLLRRPPAEAPPAPEVPVEVPAPAPTPMEASAPEEQPPPAPPAPSQPSPSPRAAPVRDPGPRPTPAVAPPAAPSAPAPAPRSARVEVVGDAGDLFLVGPAGALAVPGEVPPGIYDVRYRGADTLRGVELSAGRTLVLRCDATFGLCTRP